MNNSYLMKLAT